MITASLSADWLEIAFHVLLIWFVLFILLLRCWRWIAPACVDLLHRLQLFFALLRSISWMWKSIFTWLTLLLIRPVKKIVVSEPKWCIEIHWFMVTLVACFDKYVTLAISNYAFCHLKYESKARVWGSYSSEDNVFLFCFHGTE